MDKILEIITSQGFNSVVLSFTLLAIAWYSFETRKMKQEITAQRKFEQRPILVVYRRSENSNEVFRIRNIGRGNAFDVNIEKIKLQSNNATFTLDIGQPNILIPNEERDLRGEANVKSMPILERSIKSLAVIDPKYAKKNFVFKINYEDLEGNGLFTTVETLEDGCKIRGFG